MCVCCFICKTNRKLIFDHVDTCKGIHTESIKPDTKGHSLHLSAGMSRGNSIPAVRPSLPLHNVTVFTNHIIHH